MNCMKCGAETEGDHIFCPSCLAEMEKYPVKPDITVQIPVQPPETPLPERFQPSRYASPNEHIAQLKSTIRLLWIMLISMLVAFALVSGLLIHVLNQRRIVPIGQNYRSMDTCSAVNMDCFT